MPASGAVALGSPVHRGRSLVGVVGSDPDRRRHRLVLARRRLVSSSSPSSSSAPEGTGSSSFRSTYCLSTTNEAPDAGLQGHPVTVDVDDVADDAPGGEHLVPDVEGVGCSRERLGLALLGTVDEEVEGGGDDDEDQLGRGCCCSWTSTSLASSGDDQAAGQPSSRVRRGVQGAHSGPTVAQAADGRRQPPSGGPHLRRAGPVGLRIGPRRWRSGPRPSIPAQRPDCGC